MMIDDIVAILAEEGGKLIFATWSGDYAFNLSGMKNEIVGCYMPTVDSYIGYRELYPYEATKKFIIESGGGDVFVTLYEINQFMYLIGSGSTPVIFSLYARNQDIMTDTEFTDTIVNNKDSFITQGLVYSLSKDIYEFFGSYIKTPENVEYGVKTILYSQMMLETVAFACLYPYRLHDLHVYEKIRNGTLDRNYVIREYDRLRDECHNLQLVARFNREVDKQFIHGIIKKTIMDSIR